ncbi:MAG: hypothetical protein K2O40_05440 [Lachnospiraceae bacterium]|nr:hypothetical protein [Lachnospiraceae bacterium]
MMKKRRKSILLLATMGVFLINGCGAKEEVQDTPSETFVNEILSSVEEQTTVANETQPITSDELQLETFVKSEEPAKTESASDPEPSSGQETQTTQMPPVKEVKYMDIAYVFKPYEQAVEISFQLPEDWNYTLWDVEEESPDWGYSVKVQKREDAIISIFGQHGTLTDADSSNGPKSFQTSQGMTGQYFWDEYTLDDGNPAIQGTIIFDTELLAGFYGVSFNMPKSIYSENKDIIDKVFQSIVIKETQ